MIDPKRNKFRSDDKSTSYVPPLPFSSKSNGNREIRVNIPKPELKVSTYSKKQQQQRANGKPRYYPSATAFVSATQNPTNKYKLVDPPLPTIKRTTSHDNILQHFTESDLKNRPNHHVSTSYNSFSTNNINELSKHNREVQNRLSIDANTTISSGSESYKIGRIPRALPRTNTVTDYQSAATSSATAALQQQHIVIDVVPKPQPQTSSEWKIPDQTLGIPLTYTSNSHISAYHNYVGRPTTTSKLSYVLPPTSLTAAATASGTHQRTLLKSQSMYSIPPAATPVIHQHPITLANIPPPPSSLATNSFTDTIYHNSLLDVKKQVLATTKTIKDGIPPQPSNSILSGQMVMKKESGEKNKVKFSDTITVAVVPVSAIYK